MPGKFRKIVFIVTYAKFKDKIYYLILKRKLHWKGWEFPKGGIDFPESKKSAVKREILDETGGKTLKIKKFNFSGKYKYKKKLTERPHIIGQTYKLFSAEIKNKKVKIDKLEHSAYKWVKFTKAVKILTYPNQRKCMRIVNNVIK